jgi:CelD/BcsL family acetyltransferase involved in cellulose biosynthesis
MLDLAQDESFAAWEARRQPRARKNRKRQARKLAEQAPVSFVAFPHGEAAASMAGHAVRLKRETLDDKATVSPTLADERFERFFVDAAHGHGRPAGVTVLALVCGDAPAALKIMIESPQAAFLHLAVFEPRFGKCGAGALLLEHVVERCITDRRGMLDLLPPRHDYKLDFADATVTVDDYAIALSAKGWLYAQGFLRLRRRLKAMIEAAPKSVRRLIATLTRKQPRSAAAAASASDHSAA